MKTTASGTEKPKGKRKKNEEAGQEDPEKEQKKKAGFIIPICKPSTLTSIRTQEKKEKAETAKDISEYGS